MKKFGRMLALVLTVVLAFGVMGALTGCGDKSNELVVFTMFGGDDGNRPSFEKNKKVFLDRNEGVTIEDQSIQAVGDGFDSAVLSKFVGSEKYQPDILYVFSPGRNQAIQKYLAKVSDIRAKHSDYGKGFPEVNGDPQTLSFLGNSYGMYYEKSKFNEATDFASYSALKTKLSSMDIGELVDATGEMNTWFNYIGLQKFGKAWAGVSIPDKAWMTANKAGMISVIEEMVSYCKTGLGMGANAAIAYGDEKLAMWNGNKAFDVNGNWNAAGFYAPHSTSGTAGNYAFKSFVVDDDKSTTDVDESKYVLNGAFHGWMISKKCYNDANKLKLAVDFINAQCEGVTEYPGMATNGAVKSDDTDLAKQTKAVLNIENAIFVSPIDDKFINGAAKSALFSGLKDIMLGTSGVTATSIIEAVIAAY